MSIGILPILRGTGLNHRVKGGGLAGGNQGLPQPFPNLGDDPRIRLKASSMALRRVSASSNGVTKAALRSRSRSCFWRPSWILRRASAWRAPGTTRGCSASAAHASWIRLMTSCWVFCRARSLAEFLQAVGPWTCRRKKTLRPDRQTPAGRFLPCVGALQWPFGALQGHASQPCLTE